MQSNKSIRVVKVFAYLIVFISLTSCQQSGQQIKYINCSPSNLCFSCYNQFFCNECAPQARCCPKYCKSCTNSTYCTQCQKGFTFATFTGRNDWKACQNFNFSIDPNRDPNNAHKCKEGYYFDYITQFCQLCLIPNCKTCFQEAMDCTQCNQGFYKSGDLCLAKQVKPQPIPNPTEPKPLTNQEQDAMYILMIMIGMILGFFIACFIIQICSCTKKNCGRFYNWCKNKRNERKLRKQRQIQRLIDVEMNGGSQVDHPVISLSDQQKQFAFKAQLQPEKEYVEIRNDIEIRNKRKPIITQARNY